MNNKNRVPKVTVLMAGYKSNKEYLSQALESIKNQTFTDFEVVFVDDGCDTEIIELLNEYGANFDINIIKNDMNMGLPKSLNKGLKHARGKYIARFDDDDIMLPDRLKTQVSFMDNNPQYAGCWTEYEVINDKGKIIRKSKIGQPDFVKTFVSKGNCCCHSSLMLKNEILKSVNGYNEKFLYAQDLELYLRILLKHKMYCINSYQVQFRENTTRNPLDKRILSFVFAYASALEYVNKKRSFKARIYLAIRILVMIKFSFFDIMKQNGSINEE